MSINARKQIIPVGSSGETQWLVLSTKIYTADPIYAIDLAL